MPWLRDYTFVIFKEGSKASYCFFCLSPKLELSIFSIMYRKLFLSALVYESNEVTKGISISPSRKQWLKRMWKNGFLSGETEEQLQRSEWTSSPAFSDLWLCLHWHVCRGECGANGGEDWVTTLILCWILFFFYIWVSISYFNSSHISWTNHAVAVGEH